MLECAMNRLVQISSDQLGQWQSGRHLQRQDGTTSVLCVQNTAWIDYSIS